jgi:hypothetical protein
MAVTSPLADNTAELEEQIDHRFEDDSSPRTGRRWSKDSYAQALLILRLERLGWEVDFLTPLNLVDEVSYGVRFTAHAGHRHFTSFANDPGRALCVAALMALSAVEGRPGDAGGPIHNSLI